MIEHRPYSSLGGADEGWLKARLHFAIGNMGNPAHRPLGSLHVWNDDEFAPASGFPMHAHRDVEIVTYVRSGAITHRDSVGNEGRTVAGDVQVMSAGTGIRHSEMNHEAVPTRLFQIWLSARTRGSTPRWSSRRFPREERTKRLAVLASGYGDDDALAIDADARVLGAAMRAGDTLVHQLGEGCRAYLVTTGALGVDGLELAARDGAAVTDSTRIELVARDDTDVVLVEVDEATARRQNSRT